MSENTPLLLTDEQMKKFIQDGVLILKTDFPKEFHDRLLDQLNFVYEKEGNPGNNILPRIRELQKVFEHPVITGALTSVLGPNYLLHTHRHGHYNSVAVPGGWHKDSYWGYNRTRNHHPHWAMIMYFPQDTPVELGPTGVMPGTQNYETRTFDSDESAGEVVASGEAGTFALIHYDIWHRSTANILGTPRYMLKFEFMRTEAPAAPSWDNREISWSNPVSANPSIIQHDIMWEETWNWLSGKVGSLANTLPDDAAAIQRLLEQLKNEQEPVALNAAYELACRGAGGVDALLGELRDENAQVCRLAAYGLSISGEAAISGLIRALDEPRIETIKNAVFTLGELRELAKQAVPKLVTLLNHPSELIRQAVVEALGTIAEPIEVTLDGLIRGLQDPDAQVRFMSGLSITKLGAAAEKAVPYLAQVLDDENRYVRGHALLALRHIGSEQAKQILFDELFNNRWCYDTTPASTF
jgi:hypothetical protein